MVADSRVGIGSLPRLADWPRVAPAQPTGCVSGRRNARTIREYGIAGQSRGFSAPAWQVADPASGVDVRVRGARSRTGASRYAFYPGAIQLAGAAQRPLVSILEKR